MSSPDDKKTIDYGIPASDDPECAGESIFLSELSSDSGSEGGPSSESSPGPNSGPSVDRESVPGTKLGARENDPQLTRDELLAYLENMRRRFSTKPVADSFADQEEVLIVTSKKKDLPKLNPGEFPESYFTFETAKNGKVTLARDAEVDEVENLALRSTHSQQYVPAPPTPPPEVGQSGKPLTKKEKKALKTRTAGKDWFDLPAPAEADLPHLYREYEALRLRNHLDPKRFYRKEEGEGKGVKGLPKYFAIGTVLPTKTPFGEPSGGNLTRAERKRSLVEELLHDSEARDYAKKKFKRMQEVRGANGRGQHKKKKAATRPKW